MQTRARLADLPGRERERDEAARVVGAVHVLRDAHAPHDDRGLRRRVEARDFANRLCVDAAGRAPSLREKPLHVLGERLVARGAVADEGLVDQTLFDDDVEHRVQERDVGVGLELQVVGRMARESLRRGSATMSFTPAFAAFFIQVAATGWFTVGFGADEEDHLGIITSRNLVRHRAEFDALHERGDRGGVAQPRAMVDVVRAESRAHQLLEKVGLFVGALGRAEPGERFFPVHVANVAQSIRREIERLVQLASRNTCDQLSGSTVKSLCF